MPSPSAEDRAFIVRLRGSGGIPPQQGGWRELRGPEFE